MFDVVFKNHKFPLMFNYSTALSFPSSDLSAVVWKFGKCMQLTRDIAYYPL